MQGENNNEKVQQISNEYKALHTSLIDFHNNNSINANDYFKYLNSSIGFVSIGIYCTNETFRKFLDTKAYYSHRIYICSILLYLFMYMVMSYYNSFKAKKVLEAIRKSSGTDLNELQDIRLKASKFSGYIGTFFILQFINFILLVALIFNILGN